MTLPSSGSEEATQSGAFDLLDERIRRWIWNEGWTELRAAQEHAIPPILEGSHDVIVAAATAGGKTEAAFLPILTNLLKESPLASSVLYVSPLKALINDQWGRLERLCDNLEIPVYPWHGDITGKRKQRFLRDRTGILLITPESLESILVNRGHGLAGIFAFLRYVVVDELHSFIGSERGKQLQSLLHRLEVSVSRKIPRIGLSATLGDMSLAASFLRPTGADQVKLVIASDEGQELRLLLKGYVETPPKLTEPEIAKAEAQGEAVELEDVVPGGDLAISEHLFKSLRGANNLIFPNSRAKVELYADLLRRMCERNGMPNEFWPHHGNLSKDIRSETEAALKKNDRPASAICTTTLELGIDIGSVKSVAQIGTPPSVASLRQRLGRSGRRGDPAILRVYCLEAPFQPDLPINDRLRAQLVQSVAMVRLLLDGWYEPPRIEGWHLSTLIQQLLSLIAQYGGITPPKAWEILCAKGPFSAIPKQAFVDLLRCLHEKDMLMQQDDGLLLHGGLGEKLVNHYHFYAAFATEEEFRVVTGGKTLGTLPISRPLTEGALIIFAGRRWLVANIEMSKKIIDVVPAGGGRPPKFDGSGGMVHDRVREEMRAVLDEADYPEFLDATGRKLLGEARDTFDRMELSERAVVEAGDNCHLFLWKGDWVQDTVALMLRSRGLSAVNEGIAILITGESPGRVLDELQNLVDAGEPDPIGLAALVGNKQREKWDGLLSEDLLCRNFASEMLNTRGAMETCRSVLSGRSDPAE